MHDVSRLPRRSLLAATTLLAAPAALRHAARAASGQIVVGTWAGDYGNLLKANVEDPILVPKGYTVVQDAGDEPPRVAKIFAQQRLARGTVDVACMQQSPAVQLDQNGLLEKLDESKIPNLKYIRPDLRTDYFAPHIWSPQVLIYSPERVSTPPTSLGDLLDPRYKGRIGWPDLNFLYVLMGASLYSSDTPRDFDKAKEIMAKLNAQQLHLYPSTDQVGPAFKAGELDAGVMWLARVNMWQNAGIPVKASFPKEGCILYVSGMVVPKNAPNKEGAFAYLNAMMEPPAQQKFAERMGYLPTVSNAPLTGKVGEQLALPDPPPRLVVPDYAYNAPLYNDLLTWWKKLTARI